MKYKSISRYNKPKDSLFRNAYRILNEEGITQLFVESFKFIKHKLLLFFSPIIIYLKPKRFFLFQDNRYLYFYHKYNTTWLNERAVEVPIVMDYIKKFSGKEILEVGNVLSHYYPTKWTILDKFEKAQGVINTDIVDYNPEHKYDLVISISTLEHVGYDDVKIPEKIIIAISNLRDNCLKKGGKIVVTMPLGYNKEMDKLLLSGKLGFTMEYYLKRISRDNKWEQTTKGKVINVKYEKPFQNANACVIGVIDK